MFDCGRGAAIRLVEAGAGQSEIDKIFLTHLHSDHIISLPDMLLTGWTSLRKTPLRVWGPTGTKDMMSNMLKTFDFDIHTRRDVDEKFSAEGITVAGGHSVAMSGDTGFSENLISYAAGVVLIHEVVGSTLAEFMGRGITRAQAENIINPHTSAAETGVVFSRVRPRLAVHAHGEDHRMWKRFKSYSGPLEIADDLMTILVGDNVEVQLRPVQRPN